MSGITTALLIGLIGAIGNADAATTSLNWVHVNTTQAPAGRVYAATSYDSLRSRTVLVGGSNSPSSNFADTWEWNGTNWIQRTPATSPPGLIGAAMVFDSGRGVSVLFGGGLTAGLAPAATWEWDGTAWTQRSLAVAPSARLWHAMAFDSARGRTVLFGGNGQGVDLGDTWEFDGITWTRLFPTASPSPRYGAAMAFDSVRNRVVLFGGRSNSAGRLGDTWEWNGTNWTQGSSSTAPFPRSWHSMAFDSRQGKTILFGGDHVSPGHLGPINDTWTWDGSAWTQVAPASAPSPRAGQAMVYDSGRGKTVLFGGTDEGFPGVFYNDTWELGTPDADLAISGVPANITTNATSPGGAVVTYALPSATDEAGDSPAATVSCAPASGSTFAIGTTTATCTATDADDTPSTVSQSFTVTVLDTDLALTSMPANITVNANDPSGAVVTYTLPTALDEAGDGSTPTVGCDSSSGSTFAIGTTTVTCTATDADDSPSTVSQSFTVTVLDTDLAITGVPANITTNATSSAGAVVTYTSPTPIDEVSDNASATVGCAPASGSTFAIGTTTVTCTATDADDTPSTLTQTFTVTVLDTDLAITGVPANITTNASSPSGAVVTYALPSAVDEAGDSPATTVGCAPASGSTFAIGTTTVTCTATDADDFPSTLSQSFTVTVLDTDLAITGVPANITTNASSPSGAVVTYALPSAVDEAGDSSAATVGCAPASGSTFAIGTTTVICTATDADDAPSTVSQSFTVTVLDTDLAITGVPANITTNATSASGAVVTFALPTAIDEAGDSPAPTVSCAPTSGSIFAAGATTVTCTATSADDSPTTVSATFTVTVVVDLKVAASITPSTATTGAVVTASASLTNSALVSRTVSVVGTFTFVSPTGQTNTVASSNMTITLAAGQTVSRSFALKVSKQMARGTYTFTVTASDITGSVSSSSMFKVT
jgi:hypothetical protein